MLAYLLTEQSPSSEAYLYISAFVCDMSYGQFLEGNNVVGFEVYH
jgi:hypothetical protein